MQYFPKYTIILLLIIPLLNAQSVQRCLNSRVQIRGCPALTECAVCKFNWQCGDANCRFGTDSSTGKCVFRNGFLSENVSEKNVKDAKLAVIACPARAVLESVSVHEILQTAFVQDVRSACEETSAGITGVFAKSASCRQIDELASRRSATPAFKVTNVPADVAVSANALTHPTSQIASGHLAKSVTGANSAA